MKDINVDSIELGKTLSLPKRFLAYFSILLLYFFYTYNFSLLGVLGPLLTGEYGFSQTQFSFLFSVQSWGLLVGTLVAGSLSVRFGKKRVLMVLGLVFAFSTIAHIFLVGSYHSWVVFRFIAGMALGGTYGTCIGLIVDLFPAEYRGRLTAVASSLFAVSGALAGWISSRWFDTNWTIVIWAAIIPALVAVVMILLFVPDDLELTRSRNEAAGSEKSEKPSYRNMLKGKYLKIAIICILLSGMNFSGYSGFTQFVPIYLQDGIGMSAGQWGQMIAIQNIGQFCGFLIFGFIGDKYGRKKTLWGMLLCGLMIPIYMMLNMDMFALFNVVAFLFGLGLGYSGIWGAYYTELFPEKYRSMSAGFCFNMGRIVSSIVVLFIGIVADSGLGLRFSLVIPAVFFFIGVILWLLLPETLEKRK
ncbi:MFS transporter [Enterococcus pingfangensis]|uniref:MFS transporter n=1 Tax=Enterococcus pingfangensis TaxID=2559924 RepID=UPI0010F7EE2B|nr:MFS transporter [Enterococcus pingfangensis]